MSKSPRIAEASRLVKPTCTKRGSRPSPRARIAATSTSNPTTRLGLLGSASTNGAPPSASPPQRSSCGADNPRPVPVWASAGTLAVTHATSARHRRPTLLTYFLLSTFQFPLLTSDFRLLTSSDNRPMREWNAEQYHQISNPMFAMAMPVLERLRLNGNERVLDIGCGTGLVTEKLVDRLPAGRVIAIDASINMLTTARDHLRERSVSFVRADAAA